MEENYIVHGLKPMVPIPKNQIMGKLFLEKLIEHNDHIFMIDAATGEKVTFKYILNKSIRTAKSMKIIGVNEDDIISIISENSLNYFIPILAASYLGTIVAPINPNYTIEELMHTINIVKPKAIFCSANVLDKVLKIREYSPFIQQIVTLQSNVKIKEVENLEEFMCRSATKIDPYTYTINVNYNPKDKVFLMMSSSGTTGLPKCVMLTHLNISIALSYSEDPRFNYLSNDSPYLQSYIGLLPFFHVYGLINGFRSIKKGTKVVVMDRFDRELFLKTIQDYKISVLLLVPPIMVFLAKSSLVDKYDLSSVKLISCGAAPLSIDVEDAVIKRFKLKGIRCGYGMTEISLAGTINSPELPLFSKKKGSIGVLLPYLKCKVVEMEFGKNVGPNQLGEFCFKGPLVMKGYYGNSEATQATFDENGWLHTGDVGYYDEDQYFYIVDRIKELIKYKGFQVAPAELERVLLKNKNVKDAAVIGIPDENAGELPLAFVVKQAGSNITELELQKYVADQVSKEKWLRGGVKFVEEIPKTPSGKILRRKLREIMKSKSKL